MSRVPGPAGDCLPPRTGSAGRAPGPAGRDGAVAASPYRRRLLVAFATFNVLRVVSYLPTLWAIHASGDSSQHSMWTWFIWCGSNLLTGLWLCECNGGRPDRAAAVLLVNAALCAASLLMVAWYRW